MDNIEALLRAKIPCAETGIEIRRTLCDICAPSCHCGVDAYVKNGEVVAVAGTEKHPFNHGLLCAKGYASRGYIYRADRIKTPLVKKEDGGFREASWEEALGIIADRLGSIRQEGEADKVAFYSGYGKWYRPFLRRLAHSFGSANYGSESSVCSTSKKMAWSVTAGVSAAPDLQNASLFFGWALNPYYSNHMTAKKLTELHRRGLKIIVADPRITPASEKLADLHLRLKPGTDGALANAIANELITNGRIDYEYIGKYVSGFNAYREYVSHFGADNVEALTGVPYSQIVTAARMIHEAGHFAMKENSAALSHHRNGFQTYRAVISLLAITGSFDVRGGQKPVYPTYNYNSAGFATRERDFTESVYPENAEKPVGAERFPLWYDCTREMQMTDFARQVITGKPYPVRALFSCGLNVRMFPNAENFVRTLEKLEFIVNCDLFMTDACKYADVVLPVCSSFERGEFKTYSGGYAAFTKPVIKPLFESKSDADIICELSERLGLGDELLASGYDRCIGYMTEGLPFTIDELKNSEYPMPVPHTEYAAGDALRRGLSTPSGKIELFSEKLAAHPEWGLNPLPEYEPPIPAVEEKSYPLTLDSGGAVPNALHSRLHSVPWLRYFKQEPTVEINPADAEKYGLSDGDSAELYNGTGSIVLRCHVTRTAPEGTVFTYHGYAEANVGQLVSADALDRYTGFPAYRSVRCGIRRREK